VEATACGQEVPLATGAHRLTTSRTSAFEVESVEVSSAALPAVPAVPAGRAVTVASDAAQSRTLRVAPGDAGYLALTEGFNAGWRATVDGRELRPVRLDGWRQGWALPAGGPVTVSLDFTPGRTHRLGLLLGLLAALSLVPLALVRGRSGPLPDPAPRRWAPATVPLAGAVVAGLLAGVAGLAAGVVAGFVPGRWRAAVAGGALVLAGIVLAWAPRWGPQPAVTQLLAVGAVGLAAAGWAAREPVGEPQRGPLDDDPGQPGDPDGPEQREHRDRERAPAEGRPAGQ
jgi:arabinofuranan 3-O-arabinosyltransferase